MGARRGRFHGFTLIELMIAASIIGLLASIAIPKFANMIIKAKEAAVKGKLGALRGALSIYYSDNEGQGLQPILGIGIGSNHPVPLMVLVPKYINEIPKITIYHPMIQSVLLNKVESDGCLDGFSPGEWNAGSGWSWVGPPAIVWAGGFRYFLSTASNNVYINSGYPDSGGCLWSTW